LGVGWVIWRDATELPEELIFRVDYLGGDMPTFALNFSRPGGEIIAQYYNFIRYGRKGYREIQQACADTARYLGEQVANMGPFTLVYDGVGALPAIAYTLKEPRRAGFSLYDLSDRVRMRGWQIAPGILSGSNTISAVMGVATSAVDQGLYQPPGGLPAEQVKGNIAAAYSLTYIVSVLLIVLLVRNLPGMFGIDPVAAAKRAEGEYGAKGHALPGTSDAFTIGMLPNDVRVFRLANARFVRRPALEVYEQLKTPVLRVTRAGNAVPLETNPVLQTGDLLTVAGPVAALVEDVEQLGPEVADDAARHLDLDHAEIVITKRDYVGKTLQDLRGSLPAYGLRVRALFVAGTSCRCCLTRSSSGTTSYASSVSRKPSSGSPAHSARRFARRTRPTSSRWGSASRRATSSV
jgi:Trk K+ transport system NAD-binding subunit